MARHSGALGGDALQCGWLTSVTLAQLPNHSGDGAGASGPPRAGEERADTAHQSRLCNARERVAAIHPPRAGLRYSGVWPLSKCYHRKSVAV